MSLLPQSAAALALLIPAAGVLAGPYSGPYDTIDDSAFVDAGIAANDARFVGWANAVDVSRSAVSARGSATVSPNGATSLGDLDSDQLAQGALPGHLTVTFANAIKNGPGADFATFENGQPWFDSPFLFAELAYVRVSSDGTNFIKFDSVSTNTGYLNQGTENDYGQGYAGFDMSNVRNLAGKHVEGIGTPFDLQELVSRQEVIDGLVDLNNIRYVQFVDIPGNGSFVDSLGNGILDAWVTPDLAGSNPTGGYDFALGTGSGVGVINAVPEPTSIAILGLGMLLGCKRPNRRRR